MQSIRAFFHSEGFIEVETPVRLKTPCMELHIDAEPSGDHYLRTSPELCHKKLLGRGAEKIFEVAKCFRQGERGDLHNPEYTMLEWYRTGGDYMTALEDTKKLMRSFAVEFCRTSFSVFRELVSRCRAGKHTLPHTGSVPYKNESFQTLENFYRGRGV